MAIKHPDVTRHPKKYPEFRRTVILADIHIGAHDKRFWKVTLKWLRVKQPARVVINGDFLDAESVSRHGGNPSPPKLGREVAQAKKALLDLRTACPFSEIIYLQGNHETRLERYIIENAAALEGLLTLPDLLSLAPLNIRWVPEDKQPIRVGPAKILHGHQIRSSGLYPARKLVEIWGEPGVTVICGHFHQHQIVRKIMHPRPSVGIVLGCGRTLDPRWMGGPTGWQHSVCVIDGDKVTVLDANDGVICDGGQVFKA